MLLAEAPPATAQPQPHTAAGRAATAATPWLPPPPPTAGSSTNAQAADVRPVVVGIRQEHDATVSQLGSDADAAADVPAQFRVHPLYCSEPFEDAYALGEVLGVGTYGEMEGAGKGEGGALCLPFALASSILHV